MYNLAKVALVYDSETDQIVPIVPFGEPPADSLVTEVLPGRMTRALTREVDLVPMESPLLPYFLVTVRETNDDFYDVRGVRADQAGQLVEELQQNRNRAIGTKTLEVLREFFSDLTLDKS